MRGEHEQISRRDFLKLMASAGAVIPMGRLSRSENRNSSEIASNSLEFLPEKTIERTGEFCTENSLRIASYPLRTDFTYDAKRTVTIADLPQGFNLSFKNLYFFKDNANKVNGQEIVRATVLPDTMGHNDIVIGMIDRGSFDGRGNFKPAGSLVNGIDTKLDSVYGTMTYLVGDLSIYPNKFHNLVKSFANILEYQEANGPMVKGKVRSYIDMIKLRSLDGYVRGYNSGGVVLLQAGVCAGATLTANAMYRMAEKVGVDFKKTFEGQRDSHPIPYKLGPFSPPFYDTDTTVEIAASGKVTDYRIVAPETCYISPKFSIIPNGVPFKDTASNGLGLPSKEGSGKVLRSDAFLALNVSLTKTPPTETSASLEALLQAFDEFRSPEHKGAETISQGGKFVGDFDWKASGDSLTVIDNIFPENDKSVFDEEIAKSPFLSEVFELADILNNMSAEDAKDPASYLRKSDWYRGRQIAGTANHRLEAAINQLNSYRDPKQPIQCVQWAALIAGLGYSESPLDIGAVEMRGPNDIIPKNVLNSPYRQKAGSPTGGTIIADRYMEMKDYKAGQLFIMVNTNVGHVGVVLGSKTLPSGQRVLLVTEANRIGTGKITSYAVFDYNFDAKFGNPPNKKIIITRA